MTGACLSAGIAAWWKMSLWGKLIVHKDIDDETDTGLRFPEPDENGAALLSGMTLFDVVRVVKYEADNKGQALM